MVGGSRLHVFVHASWVGIAWNSRELQWESHCFCVRWLSCSLGEWFRSQSMPQDLLRCVWSQFTIWSDHVFRLSATVEVRTFSMLWLWWIVWKWQQRPLGEICIILVYLYLAYRGACVAVTVSDCVCCTDMKSWLHVNQTAEFWCLQPECQEFLMQMIRGCMA